MVDGLLKSAIYDEKSNHGKTPYKTKHVIRMKR